ncbi:uncharacterized protein [Venturia canescens]|uniref:uncharacterized protein n=1 Tax=Venturia canescens TaxID=32260 RepID=UPI001C9C273A|nr:uncharacterized protein LOC122417190 [Venturia canescens]
MLLSSNERKQVKSDHIFPISLNKSRCWTRRTSDEFTSEKSSTVTGAMMAKTLRIITSLLVLSIFGVHAVATTPTTRELLACRANLTADIKNETIFLDKIHQADYIFTGKIKELRRGHSARVRVKRAIKGFLNTTLELVLNDTCASYVRRSYTGIFMARRDSGFGDLRHVGKIVMNFGPIPLTLANLDRLNAAVREDRFQ